MDSLVTRHINRVGMQERQAAKHHRLPKRSWFWRTDEHRKPIYFQSFGYNPRGWVGGEW